MEGGGEKKAGLPGLLFLSLSSAMGKGLPHASFLFSPFFFHAPREGELLKREVVDHSLSFGAKRRGKDALSNSADGLKKKGKARRPDSLDEGREGKKRTAHKRKVIIPYPWA